MSLVLIRPPGELLAIAGGVQIGVPRFAEGNFPPLPKMSQFARRHMQDLACLITPKPLPFAGIRFGNLQIIHDVFLRTIQSRHNMHLPETLLPILVIVKVIVRVQYPCTG